MKLQIGKITDVLIKGSSGSGECATGDESVGLSKRKQQRSNVAVCSPVKREL